MVAVEPGTNPVDSSTPDEPVTNWVGSFSLSDLKQAQLEDPDLAIVLKWLESDVEPSQRELRLFSPAARAYWMCRAHLHPKQGVLYYQWEDENNPRSVLVVPIGLRNQVLYLCHDAKHAGH